MNIFYKVILLSIILCNSARAQNFLIGKIEDTAHNPITFANVKILPNLAKTKTDKFGNFRVPIPTVKKITVSITTSGYQTKTVQLDSNSFSAPITIQLVQSIRDFGSVVVETSRGNIRTLNNSPTPIQIYNSKSFSNQGQITLENALTYAIPSYNAVNLPVSASSTILNAFELRNLGSSRTLVLINGKRKNLSALLITQNGLDKGEVAVDLSMIPMAAIKDIEVLTDGATAQYGSDAIAGIINLILKDSTPYTAVNLFNGVTYKGDGLSYGANINSGYALKKNGFINYTINFSTAGQTNRSTNIDPNADFQTLVGSKSNYTLDSVSNFLSRYPTGKNIYGDAPTTIFGAFLNSRFTLTPTLELYATANYSFKKVQVYANYRQPYWQQDTNFLLHPVGSNYDGFLPYSNNYVSDFNATLGLEAHKNGWDIDISTTVGGNKLSIEERNSLNYSLGKNSPTNFYIGSYGFLQWVINADFIKKINKYVSISFGSELRTEQYRITQGDSFSYSGIGANTYPGIYPNNAVIANRYNAGIYGILDVNITSKLSAEISGRFENYSDFGKALVGKISLLYKVVPHILSLRGSLSNGFKAPTLHQYYYSSIQPTFANGTVVLQGIYNNYNEITKRLGIPNLKAEQSFDYSAGIVLTPLNRLRISVDYYNTTIKNRVILSSIITSNDPTNIIYQILKQYNLNSMSFFVNAVNTTTSGVDIVANYSNISWGKTNWGINLGFNYNRNKKLGKIEAPPILATAGANLFSRADESYILTSRPTTKGVVNINFNYRRFFAYLTLTYFGKNKIVNSTLPNASQSADDPNSNLYPYIEFIPKVVTDLSLSYEFTKYLELNFTIKNLFNIIPEYKLFNIQGYNERDIKNAITFNGRIGITTYDGAHFNINGTSFLTTLKFKIL